MEVLLVLSVLPSIILGVYIYRNDKVEKEPGSLLFKLFLGGLGAIFLTLILSGVVNMIMPGLEDRVNYDIISTFLYAFVQVALVEEFSKWWFLKCISWKNKEFTHLYDAIVYAVFTSLGFATIENILYVIQGGIGVAIMRAIVSVPGHAFFGIFMGYFYGLAKKSDLLKDKNKTKYLLLSIFIPALLHGIFDFCLFVGNIITVLFYLVFIITLYVYSFKTVKKVSNSQLRVRKKFCTKCGQESLKNYCTNCGNKII